jgi:hypothetical protein
LLCLRRHSAVWVLPDQARMPSPLSVVQRIDVVGIHPTAALTREPLRLLTAG